MFPLLLLSPILLIARSRRAALAMTVAAAAVVVPYMIRNYAVGRTAFPTRSGLNLFVGNSRYSAALIPKYDPDLLIDHAWQLVVRERPDLDPNALSSTEQREADTILTRLAWRTISENPMRTLRSKVNNVFYFFSPTLVPYEIRGPDTELVVDASGGAHVENSRRRSTLEYIVFSVSYSSVLLPALAGLYLRRRLLASRDLIILCIVATSVAVHALYFPATRYQAPISFVILFYSAAAIDGLLTETAKPAGQRASVHGPLITTGL
jgi:hypothetical protein